MAHRITSTARSDAPPSGPRPASIRSNIGRRRRPRRAASRSCSAEREPVTLTTLAGGSPRRTRSATAATAAAGLPVEVVAAPHRGTLSDPRRVGHRRELAEELHRRGAAADDSTRLPTSSRAPGSRRCAAARRRRPRCPGSAGRTGGTTSRSRSRASCVVQLRSPRVTTSSSPSLVTRSTRTGRTTAGSCSLSYAENQSAGHVGAIGRGPGRGCAGRSATPWTSSIEGVPAVLPAPPGRSAASRTTWSTSRCRWYDERGRPGLPR